MTDVRLLQRSVVEIPISEPLYPAAWKELSNPPQVLYAIGNPSLLSGKLFAVVGSRRTPLNALKLGGEIVKELSASFVMVTGAADGGDEAALEGALAGSGKVICLLAGGFSALPQTLLGKVEKIIERGLLLSPHSFDTPVRTYSYEYRNKLLAKLCEGVLVLGAGEKSGALITAKYAAAYHKPIFAFPYSPNSVSGCGCNRLIKEGGYLTECAADVAAYYGIVREEKEKKTALTPDEERLYTLLREKIEAHANELSAQTGLPAFKLRGLLSALEIKGLIVSLGGNRYTIV